MIATTSKVDVTVAITGLKQNDASVVCNDITWLLSGTLSAVLTRTRHGVDAEAGDNDFAVNTEQPR